MSDELKPGKVIFTKDPWLHTGEQSISNPTPRKRQRMKKFTIELPVDLYNFLVTDAEANERTIVQSLRFWLKKATGIN